MSTGFLNIDNVNTPSSLIILGCYGVAGFFAGRKLTQFLASRTFLLGSKIANYMNRKDLSESLQKNGMEYLGSAKKNLARELAFAAGFSVAGYGLSTAASYLSSWVPMTCIGRTDTVCQQVVRDTFQDLIQKDVGQAKSFAIGCYDQIDPACEDVVKMAFTELLEKDVPKARRFATGCIGRTNAECKKVVDDAFNKLLEKDVEQARFFAEGCVGQTNPTCKKLVREAFSQLHGKNANAAQLFALHCYARLDDDCDEVVKACKEVNLCKTQSPFRKAFNIIYNTDQTAAKSLAKVCDGTTSDVCVEIVNACKEVNLCKALEDKPAEKRNAS